MLIFFLLLGIEIIAGFYWLKSSLDEDMKRIMTRLDSIEGDLTVIKQQMTEPGKRP